MLDEHEFQEKAAEAFEDLEERLEPIADEYDFDVESGAGMLTLIFEEPSPSKFILSPNAPVRQLWLSALSTSYKFDWDDAAGAFVQDKTREPLIRVINNLLNKQLSANVNLGS